MKLALLSLAAVVSAVAPRDLSPSNSNPVQTGGETTPTRSLSIIQPIVSFTPLPTTDTGIITIPIITGDPTETIPTSSATSAPSPAPTSNTSGTSSHHDSSSGISTHNSTASSTTGTGTGTATGTSGSLSSSRTTSAPSSSLSSAAAAAATANIIAGIAAFAGLVLAA